MGEFEGKVRGCEVMIYIMNGCAANNVLTCGLGGALGDVEYEKR